MFFVVVVSLFLVFGGVSFFFGPVVLKKVLLTESASAYFLWTSSSKLIYGVTRSADIDLWTTNQQCQVTSISLSQCEENTRKRHKGNQIDDNSTDRSMSPGLHSSSNSV